MSNSLEELPILGILRNITEDMLEPIAEICKNTGLQSIEITMNTADAPTLISQLKNIANGRFSVGAGTVLHTVDLDSALKAGAEFIVAPNTNKELITECVRINTPVFPGALTPTEILQAWDLGATLVKVFPISCFGPQYIKEIKGPLNNVKILACGGVTNDNISEFFSFGADAVAFGGSIFNIPCLKNKDYDTIQTNVNRLISSYKSNTYNRTRGSYSDYIS